MKNTLALLPFILLLSACQGGGGSSVSGGPNGSTNPSGKGTVTDWQSALLGQEGHGGDAVVCFSIPVERALYKVNLSESNDNEKNCLPGELCQGGSVAVGDRVGSSSGLVWRMTDEGRKSIRSAKPLEQYLAEKIASKKDLINQLNAMPVEEGYKKVLGSFVSLPAPFMRLSEIHQKLGWLHEDGISSEYGLMDVNDSGFVSENEIDKAYCKELQAVVRRDHQLWYDADILEHFDNAGKVLIQLHEEFYTWGKQLDKLNERYGRVAHDTSTKTRRLILKILDDKIDHKLVNENLKFLGFSALFWEQSFKLPTSVGYYMDTDACISEQQFLKDFLAPYEPDLWLKFQILVSDRYLHSSHSWAALELRSNFPDALANMISLTMAGETRSFAADIMKMQAIFERPESCRARF